MRRDPSSTTEIASTRPSLDPALKFIDLFLRTLDYSTKCRCVRVLTRGGDARPFSPGPFYPILYDSGTHVPNTHALVRPPRLLCLRT